MANSDTEYVLGTHDEELARLGLQHQVWRPHVLRCWHEAGVTRGARVLDVGAGPGYCALDLAELVAPTGRVTAVERSGRFLRAARAEAERRNIESIDFVEQDLMTGDSLGEFDFSWCRWVACFVEEPRRLIGRIADSLRPGGVAMFHEYADYRAWRLAPRCPSLEEFVSQVMDSWRAAGGEPDIGLDLPTMLAEAGFAVRHIRPWVFVIGPEDIMWHWPVSFMETNLSRLLELGRVEPAWVERVRRDFAAAVEAPGARFVTPIVLEIVAERLPG